MRTYRPIKTTVDLPRDDCARHCLNIGRPDDLAAVNGPVSATTDLVDNLYELKRRVGYHGFPEVLTDAVYTFHILATPGLTLAIDGKVLHNKRRIGMQRIWQESIALQKGHHQLQALYSDSRIKGGGRLIDLKLSYNPSTPSQISQRAAYVFRQALRSAAGNPKTGLPVKQVRQVLLVHDVLLDFAEAVVTIISIGRVPWFHRFPSDQPVHF